MEGKDVEGEQPSKVPKRNQEEASWKLLSFGDEGSLRRFADAVEHVTGAKPFMLQDIELAAGRLVYADGHFQSRVCPIREATPWEKQGAKNPLRGEGRGRERTRHSIYEITSPEVATSLSTSPTR